MEVEVWFFFFSSAISLHSFLPLSNLFLYNTTTPPYIHHRPDYANMGSFMSSELRIFSSPRVCKEAHYHHRPIVEYSLQSEANPLALFSVLCSMLHHCFS